MTGFGSSQPPGFDQNQNTGFGTGQTASFGTQPAFGASSSLFGQQQQQQQQQQQPTSFAGFGGSNFNAAKTTASPFTFSTSNFGTGFGATQPTQFGATQPTSFGGTATGFGAPQPTGFEAPTGTGFGVAQPSTFGATTTFGGGSSLFGQPQTSTFSGFGNTAFNAPKTTASPFTFNTSTFGFGASQPSQFGATQPTSFGAPAAGFGAPQPTGFDTTASTGFGTGQPSTFGTQPTFGGGTSLFGQPQTSTFSGFGNTGFNAAKTTAAPFSFSTPGFGTQPQQQLSLLSQQQQQQQQQLQHPQVDESHAFYQSIFQCNKFADERDAILATLNYIQACWGKGKGYYSQTFPPVTYTPSNPFYRFKAVGYSFIFTDSNEEGNVVLTIRKTPEKVRSDETQMVTTFQSMLNRPNIVFKICGIKPNGEDSTVILVAEDKSSGRRVPALDLYSVLTQPYVKQHMDNMAIVSVTPKIKPSPEQLKRYLENAPDGIDPRVWKQAQEDNPDPSVMIPVSIVGIEALKKKVSWQESENQQHEARMRLIEEEISNLMNRYSTMSLELQQLRRRHYETAHRILKIVGRQDMVKKDGLPLQSEEDNVKKRLENMDSELNSPTKYKGQINELMSQIRLHRSSLESRTMKKYVIDPDALSQIKEFLSAQHESTKHLVSTSKIDLANLKRMTTDISDLASKMAKP